MNYLTLFTVISIILVTTVSISFLMGFLVVTTTPTEKLSFADKRQKSKILNYLKLR